jgi:hypothetical protein
MHKWHAVLRAAGLLGLLPGSLAAGTALAASPASKSCVMEELAEMPMIGAPLRPAVKVLINGHPAILAIDTGSVTDLLFHSAADRIGLKPGTVLATSYGIGGRSNMAMVTADTLEIGGLMGRRMEFLVPLTASEFDIDGVLGTGFVLQKDIEFDIPHNLIRFMKPRNCSGDAVVYWRQAYSVTPLIGDARHELIVQVTVNGHPVRAQIESASPRSSIAADTARSVGIPLAPNAAPRQDAIGGIGAKEVDSVLGRIETFGFGDEVIHNTEILVAEIGKFQREKQLGSNMATSAIGDEPEMFLGADFLRAHRVYVAESQRRIYISYEGGPVFEIHPDHTDAKSAPQDSAKPTQ